MLVKENLCRNSKNIRLDGWKTNINQDGNIIEATQIDENRVIVYIRYANFIEENLTEEKPCNCQFDFQKILGEEIYIQPLALKAAAVYIKDNNLKKLQISGKLQKKGIDISTNTDTKIKFMIKNFIFSKGEEFSDLWIPSTEDLKYPELYPVKVSGGVQSLQKSSRYKVLGGVLC